MNKKIALDTNIAIDVLKGDIGTIKFLELYQSIYLPITVCGELLYGLYNSPKRNKQEKRLRSFISSCKILNSSELVSEEYATIKLALKLKGHPIPENDIWIAAISNVNRIPLFTKDKHFSYIDDFEKITPYESLAKK